MLRTKLDIDYLFIHLIMNHPAAIWRGISQSSLPRKRESSQQTRFPAFAGMTFRSKLRGIKPSAIKGDHQMNKIHHINFVVKDLEAAVLNNMRNYLVCCLKIRKTIHLVQLSIARCKLGEVWLVLVQPLQG